MAARNCASGPIRRICKKHDGEFQPFRLVHGHDPHAFGSLLRYGSLASPPAVYLRFNALDEGAERGRAALEAAGHVNEPLTVCQRLFTVLPERHTGVGPHCVQQFGNGFSNRTVVAPDVKPAEKVECIGDLQASRIERFAVDGLHWIQVPNGERAIHITPVPINEKRLVAKREEWPSESGEHLEFVIGPLDRRDRIAERDDLLSIMEGPPANEDVRYAARLQRTDVGPRHIGSEILETAEKKGDVPRPDRHGAALFFDGPAALVDQPLYESADGTGQRCLNALDGDVSIVPVWFGNRQRHNGRPPPHVGSASLKRDITACLGIGLDRGRESAVDERLNRRRGAKACGEVKQFGTRTKEPLLYLLVERHVRAAETIDGLLGISDEEQLARHWTGCAPIRHARIVCREQEQDLGLDGIGVLKFVDEEMREPILELPSYAIIVAH